MGDLGLTRRARPGSAVRVDARPRGRHDAAQQGVRPSIPPTPSTTPLCARRRGAGTGAGAQRHRPDAEPRRSWKPVRWAKSRAARCRGRLCRAGGYVEYQIVVANTGPTTPPTCLVFDNCPIALATPALISDASFAPAEPFRARPRAALWARCPAGGIVTITLDVFVGEQRAAVTL